MEHKSNIEKNLNEEKKKKFHFSHVIIDDEEEKKINSLKNELKYKKVYKHNFNTHIYKDELNYIHLKNIEDEYILNENDKNIKENININNDNFYERYKSVNKKELNNLNSDNENASNPYLENEVNDYTKNFNKEKENNNNTNKSIIFNKQYSFMNLSEKNFSENKKKLKSYDSEILESNNMTNEKENKIVKKIEPYFKKIKDNEKIEEDNICNNEDYNNEKNNDNTSNSDSINSINRNNNKDNNVNSNNDNFNNTDNNNDNFNNTDNNNYNCNNIDNNNCNCNNESNEKKNIDMVKKENSDIDKEKREDKMEHKYEEEKKIKIIEIYEKKLENEEKKKNKELKNNKVQIRENISKIFKESPSSKPKIINEIRKKKSDNNVNETVVIEKNNSDANNNNNNNIDIEKKKIKMNKNTLKEGSLLRLFRCEYFDTHLHIRYLYDRKEVGVHEYLVNSLYTQRKYEDILFYLPQLSQISLVRYETSSLYRFLLDKASKSMHFALKLCWIYHSIVEDNSSKYKDLAQKMIQEIEMAVVNCKPLNNECKTFKENKQSYLLDLAYPLLFKRKFILIKIRTNEKFNKMKMYNRSSKHSYHSLNLKDFIERSSFKENTITQKYKECDNNNNINNSSQEKGNLKESSIYKSDLNNSKKEEEEIEKVKEKRKEEEEKEGEGEGEGEGKEEIKEIEKKEKIENIKNEEKKETTKKIKEENNTLPKLPPCYIINSGSLSIARAKVKLPSTYSKLGNPLSLSKFSLPDLNYSFDMIEELQQFFMKQRRCDYFSLLNNFINLIISVSNLLSSEPDIDLRNELLKRFIYSLNSWMNMRRCIVASCENTFAMTGLCIPLESLSSNNKNGNNFSYNNLQILHFNHEECKIFFSKKRAPYLLVFEVADLDEDISDIPDNIFYTKSSVLNDENNKNYEKERESSKMEEINKKNHILSKNFCCSKSYSVYVDNNTSFEYEKRKNFEDKKKKKYTKENVQNNEEKRKKYILDLNELKMDDLYVYNCIVNDLRRENLISFNTKEEENLSLIRKCIGLKADEEEEEEKKKKDNQTTNEDISTMMCAKKNQLNSRSVSMPNYLSNSTTKVDSKYNNNTNSNIKVSRENINSGIDDILIEKNIEQIETYEELKRKNKNKNFIDYNNNNIDKSHNDSEEPKENNNISKNNNPIEYPNNLLDINEYFKPENYLNEEFKKKNCRIIKRLLWGELFEEKKKKIRKISPYGKLKSWDLKCVIVKGGDDLRQELLASQLIRQFKIIFDNAGLPLWLRPYEILVTGSNSGIIEYVNDTCSVDSLKRKFATDNISTIFNIVFADYIFEAKKNFIESHAAYSLISYLLQVKDRHNGNMLLDSDGHLIHIDYGFMLTNSPGNVNFETSPFKLTQEYLDIMDGEKSDNYEYFRRLIVSGFLEARKHSDEIILFVELMMPALKIPCFANGAQFCIDSLKERFMTNLTVDVCIQRINALIEASVNNFRSVQYDYFQRITNGIM
ncbi:phosphatidylinositol 4-kinase, putative [Plasmodium gallinaceum]|uniref:1-phosphatidylinositol 4-kinase n=1 Tax=Plasmodium gallinaceum TaxID=5849 RepID=A0A1J1GZK0_PLAGA|nr:phosphatidylinositol 4-kinase, putative [Plasmodium gallinaceum]CRG97874.1 phosphatidylinositol 4-kinase, putative [Plasmodium gallinaceum]